MPIRFEDKVLGSSITMASRLPWNNAPVRSTGELYPFLSQRLADQHIYLPFSVTLFSEPAIEESAIIGFLEELPSQLEREFRIRQVRQERFVKLNLLSEGEIHKILTGHRHVQPWGLYFSREGGLGVLSQDVYQKDSPFGVVPCSSMPNHGVAWRKTPAGDYQIWLATDRKKGRIGIGIPISVTSQPIQVLPQFPFLPKFYILSLK